MFVIRSALQKSLLIYSELFTDWESQHYRSDCVEECIYKKDEITIVFQEDLREHIVNLFVTHFQRRIIKVYFGHILYQDNSLHTSKLRNFLSVSNNKTNSEKEAIAEYIDFLIDNKIL